MNKGELVFYNRWTGKNEPMGQNKICALPNCTRKYAARGLCSMHYLRLKRNGDPNTVQAIRGGDPEEERERRRAYKKLYRQRDYVKATKLLADKSWNARNRDKYLIYKRKAQAKRRAVIIMGDVNLFKIKQEWDGVCAICFTHVIGDFQFDHIIPLAKGGPHAQDNIQIVHPLCNRKKWCKLDYAKHELETKRR